MPGWLPWLLAPSGLLTTLAWIFYKLHVDAIQSQRERADDHRAIAQAATELNAVYQEQIAILLGGSRGRDEVVATQTTGQRRSRRPGTPRGGVGGGQAADGPDEGPRSGPRKAAR